MGTIYKLLLYILILVTFQSVGQNYQKESEKIVNHKIAASGEKIAFFKNGTASVKMIIRDLKQNKEYSLKGISDRTVLNEDLFIGWNRSKQKLYRITFKSGKIDSVNNVSGFHWNEKLDLLVNYNRKEENITLTSLSGTIVKTLDNVRFYSLTEGRDKLMAVTSDKRIICYDLVLRKVSERKSEYLTKSRVKRILWAVGHSAYILLNNKEDITILNFDEKKIREVAVLKRINEHDGSALDTVFTKARLLDGYIALGTKVKVENTLNSPRVWTQLTKDISENKNRQMKNEQQLLLLNVTDGTLIDLSEKEKHLDFRIGSYKDMIFSWDVNRYEDFTREYPLKEVHYYDQHSKQKKNLGFFSEGSLPLFNIEAVPSYLYFKNGDWYLYNVTDQTSKNITARSGGVFYNERFQYLNNSNKLYLDIPEPFNNKIIIQEKDDVYMYDYITDELQRVTNGKETGRRYVVQWEYLEHQILGWDLNYSKNKLSSNNIVVQWHTDDFLEEGISVISSSGNIKDITRDGAHFSQIRRNENFMSFVKEKANLPPQLVVINLNTLKTVWLYQSNSWDRDAKDIKVDYLKWKDKDDKLRGTLVRYPLNYDKNKKYPAIFRIYESKKQNRNIYENPLESFGTGFNYRDYISEGYFVIEPDILYEVGKPGISALRSVEEALNKVITAYSIDVDRVGICGHSFGGYQTNYIVTQTDRFKAAVSSAGVFDLESFYLTINWETLKPDMWRMENQQFRMGRGMYDDREAYRKNSPANFVENINTPLMLVTGDKDLQVNWQQSVMMYLAMKRLNKEVKLVLYPEEIHSLIKLDNRNDFSYRMKKWFNYYLKDHNI